MKHTRSFLQILCMSVGILLATSCENEDRMEQEEAISPDKQLAVFTFSNGTDLQFIQGVEEGEPVIMALESGKEGHENFIDFDAHSMLDIYLSLTTKEHPVPQLLINMAGATKNQQILQERKVVTSLSAPVTYTIEKIPGKLLLPAGISRGYCDNISADYCESGEWVAQDWWKSGGKYKKIEGYSYLFSDSEKSSMTVEFQYQKRNGDWKINDSATHTVVKGGWKRITYIGGSKRRRGSFRLGGSFNDPLHWRGWTDVRN